MVVRVARAIAGHFGPEFDELPVDRKAQRLSIRQGDAYCDHQAEMLDAARAAIEAMREPTEAMTHCGAITPEGFQAYSNTCETIWAGMIEAALSPQVEEG